MFENAFKASRRGVMGFFFRFFYRWRAYLQAGPFETENAISFTGRSILWAFGGAAFFHRVAALPVSYSVVATSFRAVREA